MNDRYYVQLGDYEIAIDQLPDRKKPCLIVKAPGENSYVKVASFNDRFSAVYFVNYVKTMFKGRWNG